MKTATTINTITMKKITVSVLTSLLLGTSVYAQTTTFGSTGLNQTNSSESTIFKNNGNERMRILPNGNVGIGTSTPAEKLHINGNLKVDGNIISNGTTTLSNPTLTGTTSIEKAKMFRLTPYAGDSIIRIGDSTIQINTNSNNIAYTPSGINRGLSIGNGISTTITLPPIFGGGSYTTFIPNVAQGTNSLALGFRTGTGSSATNAITIGAGNTSSVLSNPTENTLWVGFNSSQPTLFVGASGGGSSTANVGIGTTNPQSKLEITGTGSGTSSSKALAVRNGSTDNFLVYGDGYVFAREVQVTLGSFTHPDYVFKKGYNLMPLKDLALFINKNGHLPNIPSADQVEKNGGIKLGEMQEKLLEKVEELTLYILKQQEEIEALKLELSKTK